MAGPRNIEITRSDILHIADSNLFFGGKNIRDIDYSDPKLKTGKLTFPRPGFNLEEFFKAYFDNAYRHPWHFDVVFPTKLTAKKRVTVFLQPFKVLRDAMGCGDAPEYKYGYELPRLLIDEPLTIDTANMLENAIPAISAMLNLDFLQNSAPLLAFLFMVYIHLIDQELIFAMLDCSPMISSRALNECKLSEKKLLKIKSMSEQDKAQLELAASRPAFILKDILEFYNSKGQRTTASFLKELIGKQGIFLFSTIPHIFMTFDKLRILTNHAGQTFAEPLMSVQYSDAKLVLQLKEIIQAHGKSPKEGIDIFRDSFLEFLGGQRKDVSVFRKMGQYWTVVFEQRTHRSKNTKGMDYIHQLLCSPHSSIHVLDLMNIDHIQDLSWEDSFDGRKTVTIPDRGSYSRARTVDLDSVLDSDALNSYESAAESLRKKLQSAINTGDLGLAGELRQKIDFIEEELRKMKGIGGRSRKFTNINERARKAVSERVRRALKVIQAENPDLWRHLANSISLGIKCSYNPEHQIDWIL